MATKIRLQRHGKKRAAYYHIVAADARAKRDGRFIEKIGTYNPNTNPATIDLDFDRALHWVKVGAVPTDTVKTLLSYKGVLLKNHLDNGVLKGALTEAEAQKKFDAWMEEKSAKISGKSDSIAKAKEEAEAAKLAAEKEVNEARAKEIEAKNAPEVEEVSEEVAEEAPAAEAEEAPAAEAEEAPAAEAEEAPAEEEAKSEEE
ncbi:MAG: 30S ribosomal protein S16 [Crocinitomicaceae bacterium]